MSPAPERAVRIALPDIGVLDADLTVVQSGGPLVVFAHGSGSSRHSSRNQSVARRLQSDGFGTLLLDLLTEEEDELEQQGARRRFDVDQLADRLVGAIAWIDALQDHPAGRVGCFGASTGAAGALVAAARQPGRIAAVVSRGGRPDLAGERLPAVEAPTLLIVGGHDPTVIELNEQALARMGCTRNLEIVPGATHLFEEPGTLETVADLAAAWFGKHLRGDSRGPHR